MLAPIVLAILVAHAPVTAQAHAAQRPAAPAAQPTAETPWPPVGVFRSRGGVTAPRLIKSARPNYTAEAMRAKVQGRVMLEAVVQRDGTVGELRVTRSLDCKFGLDDAAVKALKEFRFTQESTISSTAQKTLVFRTSDRRRLDRLNQSVTGERSDRLFRTGHAPVAQLDRSQVF
jgi:TonB family protein